MNGLMSAAPKNSPGRLPDAPNGSRPIWPNRHRQRFLVYDVHLIAGLQIANEGLDLWVFLAVTVRIILFGPTKLAVLIDG